jgi:uncharacterized membrane protein YsdA (DUF1294 family)
MVQGIIIWTVLASIVTGLMYAWDKRAAVNGGRRIPEKSLLAGAILGGWPGAFVVGQLVRHKTQKHSFRLAYGFCVALNISLIVGAVLCLGRCSRFT